MEKIEIELKFLLQNVEELVGRLKKLSKPKETYQKDTYFIPSHRDFLKQNPISEWLRIRESNKGISLNYKNWHNKHNAEAVSCDECETEFEDVNALKKILENLDFKEIVVVKKNRSNWLYNNTIISIDKVAGLGNFIEIELDEVDGKFENVEESKKHLFNVLEELGVKIGDPIFMGYPHIILEKQGYFKSK
jgi:adenylate cyclase class 2